MKNNNTIERNEKQRQIRRREEQYNILGSLGWKGFGIGFLIITIVIIIYAVYFR